MFCEFNTGKSKNNSLHFAVIQNNVTLCSAADALDPSISHSLVIIFMRMHGVINSVVQGLHRKRNLNTADSIKGDQLLRASSSWSP